MIHNVMTGEQCRHCDEGRGYDEGFILWGFVATIDGLPAKDRTTSYGVEFGLHNLIAAHHLSPAAESMSTRDILHQFNQTQGGEAWLTLTEDPPPWVIRRLELANHVCSSMKCTCGYRATSGPDLEGHCLGMAGDNITHQEAR